MALITVPDELDYSDAEMDYLANVMSNTSRTGGTQRILSSGSLWAIKINFPLMVEEDIRAWRSFLMAQGGGINEFLFGPPGYTGASVYANNDILVDLGSQTGVALNVKGGTPSATVLLDGEFFSVNNELKVHIGDLVLDGAGKGTMNFEPMLRTSPANNTPVEIQAPKARFALSESNVGISYTIPSLQNIKPLVAIEVFA